MAYNNDKIYKFTMKIHFAKLHNILQSNQIYSLHKAIIIY